MTWHPRANELFLQARELRAADRRALLDRECAADSALRAEVEALLAADGRAGDFLERPAADPEATATYRPAPDRPGTVVDQYKLLQPIGEGGMGTVWMADQAEPVQRRVALKLIKAGMGTAQVVARFEAERQALALMDHPNIAKVLDAGATADGRPYFAMELVKGVPITKYCDEHRLTPTDRLGLFVSVCEAVQHAHQKGVIHRDLKPSNVLVAPYDGRPVVKVIDFGVAKATGQALTDKTLFTAFGAVVGTLEYMSPEQAELNNQDVDTRSDIYSLGVLLYELLTGTTPLGRDRLRQAALAEVLRLIREEEPPRPSTRLSASTDSLPAISAQRRTEPARLTRLVRGELDWIVMKALEKDRARRYETANGLAQDVQRYLAGEPVQAVPPSAGYRVRKFVRKNRGPVLATGLVFLALLAGIVGTTLGLIESRRQADRAREAQANETARAEAETQQRERAERALAEEARQRRQARQAVDDMYSQVAQKWLAQEPRMQKVQREFLEKALRYYEDLSREDGTDPEVRFETAKAFRRMGRMYQTLGQNATGTEAYGRAIAILEELTAASPAERGYRQELADSHHNLGYLQMYSNRLTDAESSFGKALALYQQLVADFGPDAALRRDLASTRHNLGNVLSGFMGGTARPDGAKEAYRQSADIYKELVAADPDSAEHQSSLAAVLNDWALVLLAAGDVVGAGPLLKEAVDRQKTAIKLEPRRPTYRQFLASHLVGWADVLKSRGDHAGALKAAREAVAVQAALADDFPDVPHYRHAQAEYAFGLGELLDGDDDAAAAASFRQAIALLEPLADSFADVPARRVLLADSYKMLGLFLDAAGRPEEAAASFRSALKWQPKDPGTLAAFGKHLLKRRQFAEAEPVWRESLKAREERQPDAWMTFFAKAQLGASLLGQKKYAEAEPLLLTGYEGLKQREANLEGEEREHLTDTAELLVRLYEARNQPDKAADWRKKLAAPKTPGKKD